MNEVYTSKTLQRAEEARRRRDQGLDFVPEVTEEDDKALTVAWEQLRKEKESSRSPKKNKAVIK